VRLSILTFALFLTMGQNDCRQNKNVIEDLGTLGAEGSFGLGVNSTGSVTGASFKTPGPHGGELHAFRYIDGLGMIDVGALPSSNLSEGQGINKGGAIAGGSLVAELGDVNTKAFMADSNLNLTDIGTPGRYSYAWDVNDLGQVTGEADNDLLQTHAFVWQRSFGMQDLGTLGGSRSVGRSINEFGQVAGESATRNDSATHAFRFSAGQGMRDLGTLGGRKSSGYGINDHGEVVGESDFQLIFTPTTSFSSQVGGLSGTHAFFWSEGAGMKDMGHLGGGYSIAHAVNNNAEAVGYSTIPGGARRAFRWTIGGMKDLNSLLPGGSGWVLSEAWDINDRGQIVGNGIHNGKNRAFRLNLPTATVLNANFDADSLNSPKATVGTLSVEPNDGTVNVILTPLPGVQATKWIRIGFPATRPRSSVKGRFSRFDGPGLYTITATMFIRGGTDIVTLQFEPENAGPLDYLHFMHLDFMPEGDVRIDDGPRFGHYSKDKVFNLRVNLIITSSAAMARITLSGPGAVGSTDYTLPRQSLVFGNRFNAIRFWLTFGQGQFFVDDILVTRRDL